LDDLWRSLKNLEREANRDYNAYIRQTSSYQQRQGGGAEMAQAPGLLHAIKFFTG
jgi:hypothetical protein